MTSFPKVPFPRVAIVGAGAIGGWLGVHLARSGCELSALARGETLAALQRDGLQLRSADHSMQAPVTASQNSAALGVQDLVILAVKAPALAEVTRQIGPLIGRHTVVLTAMNGVPWWFLDGFGGALAGTRLTSTDCARHSGAPCGGLRGARELLGGRARCGAAPLRQWPDPGRAGRR
jgi:2-dehydropantoate 2-reductase